VYRSTAYEQVSRSSSVILCWFSGRSLSTLYMADTSSLPVLFAVDWSIWYDLDLDLDLNLGLLQSPLQRLERALSR
jgi:hypothetical protein